MKKLSRSQRTKKNAISHRKCKVSRKSIYVRPVFGSAEWLESVRSAPFFAEPGFGKSTTSSPAPVENIIFFDDKELSNEN